MEDPPVGLSFSFLYVHSVTRGGHRPVGRDLFRGNIPGGSFGSCQKGSAQSIIAEKHMILAISAEMTLPSQAMEGLTVLPGAV